jgi:hypothetical protein
MIESSGGLRARKRRNKKTGPIDIFSTEPGLLIISALPKGVYTD